jgi:hypothetical protein
MCLVGLIVNNISGRIRLNQMFILRISSPFNSHASVNQPNACYPAGLDFIHCPGPVKLKSSVSLAPKANVREFRLGIESHAHGNQRGLLCLKGAP